MGLIRTLVDYGQQAYDGLKQPAAPAAPQSVAAVEEVHYPQIKLSGVEQQEQKPRLEVKNLKQSLGQDTAFVQTTIRQKLAEYGLPARASIQLYRDDAGAIRIQGTISSEAAGRIEQDINRNPDFKERYLRISQNQPTLDYIQNNLKITTTYGSSNSIFDSLISANPQHNSLQDLTTRFSNLNKAQAVQTDLSAGTGTGFSLKV